MRSALLLLSLCALQACASAPAVYSRSGTFAPGAAIVVRNVSGDIDAYAPARGQPADRYTVKAYAANGQSAVDAHFGKLVAIVTATRPGVRFLVRGPRGTTMNLSTTRGNINVADFEGILIAHTAAGDIKALIPQYGQASTLHGNISMIFASTSWPGTLHFTAQTGNVELYVNENAKAHVRLHTDDGTVFSDFNVTGTSSGTSETIVSAINGGGPRAIDVEVHRGSIRLMQLKPQV